LDELEPFDELASELRMGAGRQFRDEAEDLERLADLARLRRRTLAGIAAEAFHRGDVLAASAGTRHYKGPIVDVGADFVTIDSGAELVDLRLGAFVMTLQPGRRHALPTPSPQSFRARLVECEGTVVRLVAVDQEWAGMVAAVARDHLLVVDGGTEWFVPDKAVVAVVRTPFRQ
jgi:hypothetical protein